VITDVLQVPVDVLARETGWKVEPQGACRGERCVPLPAGTLQDGRVELPAFAERLGMPLLHDEQLGLWALGPEAGGRAMTTVTAPDLTLPRLTGEPFPLSALRGKKVLIAAWASW
jgi:hypothetical protein